MSKKRQTHIKLILKGSKDMTEAQILAFADTIIKIQRVLNERKRDEAKV